MQELSEVATELCRWYGHRMTRLEQAEMMEQCELLLCASDLGIETSGIRGVLAKLVAAEEPPEDRNRSVLHSTILQLVFA